MDAPIVLSHKTAWLYYQAGLSRNLCKSHFSYRYLSILGRTASSHRSWLRTWDQPA